MPVGIFLTLSQVGMGQPEIVVPITALLAKELVLKGSFRYGVRITRTYVVPPLTY
jgi:hypothetical protein